MSDEELLETYRASFNKAMDEASARDGFATNMSRESIVAGLRAVFDMSKGEKPAEDEPLRDADGDMISSGEHRKISMSGDSFFVCDTCTNVLGLNVRWDHAIKREDHQVAVESLPDKPAEDEREDIARIIDGHVDMPVSSRLRIARSLQGNGYRKGPRPITDEMVEAALDVCFPLFPPEGNSHLPRQISDMRAALEAADEARR